MEDIDNDEKDPLEESRSDFGQIRDRKNKPNSDPDSLLKDYTADEPFYSDISFY